MGCWPALHAQHCTEGEHERRAADATWPEPAVLRSPDDEIDLDEIGPLCTVADLYADSTIDPLIAEMVYTFYRSMSLEPYRAFAATTILSGNVSARAQAQPAAAPVKVGTSATSFEQFYDREMPRLVALAQALAGPAVAGTGQTLKMTNTLANVGVGKAGNWSYHIYLSPDPVITTNDTFVTMKGDFVDFPAATTITISTKIWPFKSMKCRASATASGRPT